MPRSVRAIEAGTVYHVLKRANGRMRLFHKEGDYAGFLKVLAHGLGRYPVDLFTYCRRLAQAAGRFACLRYRLDLFILLP